MPKAAGARLPRNPLQATRHKGQKYIFFEKMPKPGKTASKSSVVKPRLNVRIKTDDIITRMAPYRPEASKHPGPCANP